ncbi:MAG: DNA repair protein RadA [Bacteroidia bacterium]
MAKSRTFFVCQQCGYKSIKWGGKCPSCGAWNSFAEEVEIKETRRKNEVDTATLKNRLEPLGEYTTESTERWVSTDQEFNRVLGGGIVPGSLVLLGGEPGIGKSTLLLQITLNLPAQRILYVSGEESLNQIKMRAKRLDLKNPDCYLLAETNFETIAQAMKSLEPTVVIIDSIQTLYHPDIESAPGSVPQIRGCTAELIQIAKKRGIAICLIGHITKEGYIAGPKVLEHMVDTVLYFEGDRHYNYRILRTIKNRFGSISEIGIYEMTGKGLQIITNPSEILLNHREEMLSGISVAAMLEGIRPMLIEIQALVSPTFYGNPQRTSTGFDSRRMSMLLAVLEKRCGLKLNSQDVFLNIAGGLKVEDPSIDLAVTAAIASSFEDIAIPGNICFAGEVGLSGEIRPVNQVEKRISEAEKQGFSKIYLSSFNKKSISKEFKIELALCNSVNTLLEMIF